MQAKRFKDSMQLKECLSHLEAERVSEGVLQGSARCGEAGLRGFAGQQAEHGRPHRRLARRAALRQRRQLRARLLQGLLLAPLLRQAAELATPQLEQHLRAHSATNWLLKKEHHAVY